MAKWETWKRLVAHNKSPKVRRHLEREDKVQRQFLLAAWETGKFGSCWCPQSLVTIKFPQKPKRTRKK